MMAAIAAARSGAQVLLLEANVSAGNKLLRTGRWRCNITHDGDIRHFMEAYGRWGRFMRPSLYEFSASDCVEFFNSRGVPTKVEEDGSVFPVSDDSSDVKNVLEKEMEKLAVRVLFCRKVLSTKLVDEGFEITTIKETISAEKLIIATGGKSWPATGSTGDGYIFASSLGHKIITPKACLIPLVTHEKWCSQLSGTPVGQVRISAKIAKEKHAVTGPFLFSHHGIGGPAVLNFSRLVVDNIPITVNLDFRPDMGDNEIEEIFLDERSRGSKKTVTNIIADIVPRKLAMKICEIANIELELTLAQLKKEQRRTLCGLIKSMELHITGTRPIEEATITRGGVDTSEIDSKTMESKICKGLYLAGEVIDVDGPCGGYNLQVSWSTGTLAGKCAAKQSSTSVPACE